MMRTALLQGAEPHGGSPLVVGLTGPIAAGKSTVAKMLRNHGAEIIDADRVYHTLISPNSALSRAIVERFGSDVLGLDGSIDRKALGKIVFNNPAAMADLEQLAHPAVLAEVRRRVTRSKASVVVVEAIKLFGSALDSDMDAIWLVTAEPKARIQRLMHRSGMAYNDAAERVAAAIDPMTAGMIPDVTIDTSGSLEATIRAVDDAWRALIQTAA
jgi:dephospho-CoA kinase